MHNNLDLSSKDLKKKDKNKTKTINVWLMSSQFILSADNPSTCALLSPNCDVIFCLHEIDISIKFKNNLLSFFFCPCLFMFVFNIYILNLVVNALKFGLHLFPPWQSFNMY